MDFSAGRRLHLHADDDGGGESEGAAVCCFIGIELFSPDLLQRIGWSLWESAALMRNPPPATFPRKPQTGINEHEGFYRFYPINAAQVSL